MKNQFISEIFLTEKFVTEEAWLEFIFEVSRLNGIFRKWDIFVFIELNTVRYFIRTSRKIPPVISNLNNFLLRITEPEQKIKKYFKTYYFMKNNEKNILIFMIKTKQKKQEN